MLENKKKRVWCPGVSQAALVCVNADKAMDCDADLCEMVGVRVNYNGTPVTFNTGRPVVGTEYIGDSIVDSDEKEANSGACFNKIFETIERCGAVLIYENKKSCYEAETYSAIGVDISEQLRSDGLKSITKRRRKHQFLENGWFWGICGWLGTLAPFKGPGPGSSESKSISN